MRKSSSLIVIIILIFCILIDIAQSKSTNTNYWIKLGHSPEMVTLTDGFSPLKKKLDAGYILIENNTLDFIYIEEYSVESGQTLSYEIYDNGYDPGTIDEPSLTIQYGENRLSANLTGSEIQPDTFYILEVTDRKGEKWYLKFKTP